MTYVVLLIPSIFFVKVQERGSKDHCLGKSAESKSRGSNSEVGGIVSGCTQSAMFALFLMFLCFGYRLTCSALCITDEA